MFTFFLICFLLIHFESASFFYGQPCSELNTIYLHQFSSKIILENNRRNLKKIQHYCIDVTKIDDITDLYRIRYSIEERSLKIFYATDTLYADNMRLRKLPINFLFNLPNLKMLDLSGNKIRKINTKIYKYSPSLEKLLLADNRILIPRKYPLIKSSTLELLMLTRNNIHQIYKLTFSKLPNLKILYLNENKIKSISSDFFKSYLLSNLIYLHLGKNMISKFPLLESMPRNLTYYIKEHQFLINK